MPKIGPLQSNILDVLRIHKDGMTCREIMRALGHTDLGNIRSRATELYSKPFYLLDVVGHRKEGNVRNSVYRLAGRAQLEMFRTES